MNIGDLVRTVSSAYGDAIGTDRSMVASYHEPDADYGEDALAMFIAAEVRDTFDALADNKQQLAEAARVLRVASLELFKTAIILEVRSVNEGP